MKKYIKVATAFIAVGIVCGVFFREFSKAQEVVNVYTVLGLVHPHFLVLGGLFTLVIGLVTDRLACGERKLFRFAFPTYIVGVAGTGAMLLVRGVFDVLARSDAGSALSKGANAAISGMAGIFHAVLGVGLVLILAVWLSKDKTDTVA